MLETERLISHSILPETLETVKANIIQRLQNQPETNLEFILDILDQLSQFDLGRYLLMNKGLNGYWTHYMLMHPRKGRITGKNNRHVKLSELETFLLDRAPTVLATQQRFNIFLNEIQKNLVNNASLACIPCGMMGELLCLDFTAIEAVQLTGIDFDEQALVDAKSLAIQKNLERYIKLLQNDAWNLTADNEFDLISSNGLTIYEPNDEKVTELYQNFNQALKKGGKLVTSFLTPPPSVSGQCEWKMQNINQEDLAFQKLIFADIIGVNWQCYRSSQQTRLQLETAGFNHITFIYDTAKMFPTVTAVKS